jgi:hypothetical protein
VHSCVAVHVALYFDSLKIFNTEIIGGVAQSWGESDSVGNKLDNDIRQSRESRKGNQDARVPRSRLHCLPNQILTLHALKTTFYNRDTSAMFEINDFGA